MDGMTDESVVAPELSRRHANDAAQESGVRSGGSATADGREPIAEFLFGTVRDRAAIAATAIAVPVVGASVKGERWTVRGPVVVEERGGMLLRRAPGYSLGVLRVPLGESADLESRVAAAYSLMFEELAKSPHLVLSRIWNYLPRINEGEGDDERYVRFCVGRAQAMEAALPESRYPTATCVGIEGEDFVVGFLAADRTVHHLENPRQVSAFRYPRIYGRKSPAFARGSLVQDGNQALLFLGGTASIRGSASLFPHDVDAQCVEAMRNIEALLDRAGRQVSLRSALRPKMLRVYLRDQDHADVVQNRVRDRFGDEVALLLLRADLCRKELLLEIDGVFAATIDETHRQERGRCEVGIDVVAGAC
jgi:chorismate lyase/3-hydroxybenzoate synthase